MKDQVDAVDGLVKGIRSPVAEAFVAAKLAGLDPTVTHVGGRERRGDLTMLDGTRWVEVKSGWIWEVRNKDDVIGFSAVRADHPADLVAVVVMRDYDLAVNLTHSSTGFTVEWPDVDWYLLPTAVALKEGVRKSRGRTDILPATIDPYRVDGDNPMTSERLADLFRHADAANVSAPRAGEVLLRQGGVPS